MLALSLFLASSMIGTIVWGVRLEGKQNTAEKVAEQKHIDLKELIEFRFDAMDQRLERIERAMNGALRGHN